MRMIYSIEVEVKLYPPRILLKLAKSIEKRFED